MPHATDVAAPGRPGPRPHWTIAGMMVAVGVVGVVLGSVRTSAGPIVALLTCAIVAGLVAPLMAYRRVLRLDARLLASRPEPGPRTDGHILRLGLSAVLTWMAWFGVGYLIAVLGAFASFRLTGRG